MARRLLCRCVMRSLRSLCWSPVFGLLTLLAALLCCLTILVPLLSREIRVDGILEATPVLLAAGIVVSGCTVAYSTIESIRCMQGYSPVLTRILAVLLIVSGLVSSYFSTAGALRIEKRAADTALKREVRYIPPNYLSP
jgi:hypothetical protein